MKRVSPGASAPALLLLAAFLRCIPSCIPSPDTSGLPPYDAGIYAEDSSGSSPASDDSGLDATIGSDSGSDGGAPEAAAQLGTVSGIVIDYTEANGQGVVPGAVVSVSFPSTAPSSLVAPAPVTTDANGLFTIANVPAGVSLQISATKPTDLVNGVAYSTTAIVTTVPAGQTVNVFPILHEGCFQIVALNPDDAGAGTLPVTLQNATCRPGGGSLTGLGTRVGAYAAMTFDAASFKDPINGSLWTGSIRVEMIPLAYPFEQVFDLSWALGLPGAAAPPGLLGAAEYRVVKSDPAGADDGQILALANPANDPVAIAVPVYTGPSGQALAYSYDTTAEGWKGETATPGPVQMYVYGEGQQVAYLMVPVPHLSWWGATNGATPTTCVTGTLQAGAPLPNVLVRAAGLSYLGTSTGLTDSTGLFCLDVPATAVDGGTAQIAVYAEALVNGAPYSATPTFQVSPVGGASCAGAAGVTACASLGAPIGLAPSLTCVSGAVAYDDAGGPATLDVTLVNANVAYAQDQGIQSSAYLGQVTLGKDGSFCAPAPPGASVELVQPTNSSCWAPNDDYIIVPPAAADAGTTAATCAGGGCLDAGPITFGCPG